MESLEERLYNSRIPTIQELGANKINSDIKRYRKTNYLVYNNLIREEVKRNMRKENGLYMYCCISVIISFILGLSIGVILMGNKIDSIDKVKINAKTEKEFPTVSFVSEHKYNKEIYPKSLTEDMREILKDNTRTKIKINIDKYAPNDLTVLYDNIYWGPEIENAIPQGYGENSAEIWESYVDDNEIVKMEAGCGRMQNRLVTFQDGMQACVRYRQNTDQIQGEIFSFYVGRLLNLTNLAPSVVKVVDLKDKLWKNVANEVTTAQWNSNRAVVFTQYIPSLESATIPEIFKPSTRHLNKIDIYNMVAKENDTIISKDVLLTKIRTKAKKTDKVENFDHIDMKLSKNMVNSFLELAQWSDLIIFDYLTANLDRIVNNLFNYQWNVNIMDGPAHNLAKKMDSGLLVFLDNESGLLHGYRLLKKYNVYHSLMLDNLCVFRKKTVDSLKSLYENPVGAVLSDVFHKKNNAVIRDVLPPLPDKNAKILQERIGKVLAQIEKCKESFR